MWPSYQLGIDLIEHILVAVQLLFIFIYTTLFGRYHSIEWVPVEYVHWLMGCCNTVLFLYRCIKHSALRRQKIKMRPAFIMYSIILCKLKDWQNLLNTLHATKHQWYSLVNRLKRQIHILTQTCNWLTVVYICFGANKALKPPVSPKSIALVTDTVLQYCQ